MSRMRARTERHSLEEEHRAAIEEALWSGTAPTEARSAAGDHARLRGIPMIGGASGVISGTVPHRNRRLDSWSGR